MENYAALKNWLTEYMLTQDAGKLEVLLTDAGVPAAMLRNVGEIMQHPHIAERGLVWQAGLPGHDQPLEVLGPGFAVEHYDVLPQVPVLGADTDAVLAELGLSAEAIAALRADKAI